MQISSHVTCPICCKKLKLCISKKHIIKHGYKTMDGFIKDYPNQLMETERWKEAKKELSRKANIRFNDPIKREAFRKIVCHPITEETKRKLSESIKVTLSDPEIKKKMYTVERNNKISIKKFEYWKNNPEEKKRVANTWKVVRDKDPVKWKKHLLGISQMGFEAAWGKKETTLETKYYSILRKESISFIPQYELEGRFFDAYLTDNNILIEFDGCFWHPESIDDCQYEWQKHNYSNDREKDLIAESKGIRLIRIREDEPVESIKNII